MSIASRELTTREGGNVTKTCAGSRELTAEIRHRVVEHGRGATIGHQAAWSRNDHLVLRAGRLTLTLFAVVGIFPACVRAETYVQQTTEKIAAAYGEWWDSTGTVYTAVVSNVVSQTVHDSRGAQDTVTYGQVVFLQHDLVTGEEYLGSGLVDQAPTFRGDLVRAFYEVEIPLSRLDHTIGEYVDAGTVTVKINLEGYGPITKSKYGTASMDVPAQFVGTTRNATPTFTIDGAEVDAGLFEFAAGYLSDNRVRYQHTVHP